MEMLVVEHFRQRDLMRIFSRIRIDAQTGCWLWIGTNTTPGGYGRLKFAHRCELVHRIMYAWLVEPLPRGRGANIPVLDHFVCDRPSCCNPAHLKLVTNRENCLRAFSGPIIDNAAKTHCIKGHELPTAPNDSKRRKRYCLVCACADSAKRRTDPESREVVLAWHREYHRQQWHGPRREELLKKAREAAHRYYYKRKEQRGHQWAFTTVSEWTPGSVQSGRVAQSKLRQISGRSS